MGDGPQPPEAVLSVICDAFGCTPNEAKAMDWMDVKGILDFRLAASAKDQHNRKVDEMSPAQVNMMTEMIKAAENG